VASGEIVEHEVAATLMRQTVQAMAKDIDGRLREHRLTLVQRRALTLLSGGQVVTPGDVSLALEVDAGATSRLLDRLVAKGMCRRHRDDGDRRSVHLELTELGRSALEMTQSTVSAVMVEWFSAVEGSDLEVVRRVLAKMLGARK